MQGSQRLTTRKSSAWSALLATVTLGTAACGGPKATPTPPPAAKAPAAAPWTWTFASDLERISRLFVAGREVWGVTQVGLIHWDRQSGEARAEGNNGPGPEVTAIAVGSDGVVYAGLPSGIAWRKADGTWDRTSAGPLSGGVTALAPRAQGGVWVGLASGLAHFADGRLHLVNERHRVRGFSAGSDGTVWAATDGFGVVRLGAELTEFTSAQGLCGNQIRSVFVGPGGQIGVTCLETLNRTRFSLGRDGAFTTWEVRDLPNPIERVEPLGDRILLRTVGADFRLEVDTSMSTKDTAKAKKGIAPAGLRATPLASVEIAEPPPPVLPTPPAPESAPASGPAMASAPASGPAAPASQGSVADELSRLASGSQSTPAPNVKLPPPVAMPAPIAPVAPPPVDDTPLPVSRAIRRDLAGGVTDFRLRDYPVGVPNDAEVTATLTTSDGTHWYALAFRGIVAIQDAQRRRYSSQTLVPVGEGADLAADRRGKVIMTDGLHRLLRWQENTWNPWVVDPDRGVLVLGAAFDEFGQVWCLGWKSGEAKFRVYKSTDGASFSVIGQVDVPKLDGPPRTGRLAIDHDGTVLFPLFWLDKAGKTRAAGLGRIGPSMERVEVWGVDSGMDDAKAGEIRLPDAWVGALATAPAGKTLFLGTNAGLARIAGQQIRTFNENDFLASEVILAVEVDGEGRLWAGTMEGLGYLAADEWHGIKGRDGGLTDRVLALRADVGGRMWVGTDAGLYLGQNDRFARVSQDNGGFEVPGPVRDIELDGNGGVWVITGQGILHATPTGKR
jgi:ligand-binding sensor domain-containing protein